MADKLGLIDPDTGAAAPVKAAGYALAVQENVIDQQTALGLNSAAFEPVSAFADAATASIARAAVTWQNIADLKLLHADAQGELDPVGGANLRTLPPPYATLLTAALPIVNSTAPTVIASITPPTGVAPTVGEAVTILCVGSYFNTTAAGATSQFTLSIALGGTVVFQDDVSNINAHASQRPMIIELQLIRAGAATAVLYGQAIVSVGGPAAVGFGDQSTLISRGNPLVAPVIQGSLLTYDWSNPPAITITLALGTAHAEHQYNRGFVRAYADRLHVIEATPDPTPTVYPWLDDVPVRPTITRTFTVPMPAAFPLIASSTILQALSAEEMACLDLICCKPSVSYVTNIAAAQVINPTLMWLRVYSPVAWQGATEARYGISQGYDFWTTGPATLLGGGEVFAGHWLYNAGGLTTTALTATGLSVSTTTAGVLVANTYVVIYDAPAGSFGAAEHARVVSVVENGGTYTATLERGYRSAAVPHAAGSIIARHAQGNATISATAALLWRYNLSSGCPLDSNGKQANQIFPEWLAANYDRVSYAAQASATCHGVVGDSEFFFDPRGGGTNDRPIDFDNSLTVDYGIDAGGVNRWSEGLNAFYGNLRAAWDVRGRVHAIYQSGDSNAPGITNTNGNQPEAWCDDTMSETGDATTRYMRFNRHITRVQAQLSGSAWDPQVFDGLNKTATKTYPAGTTATSNAPFRLSFGMALMFGMYYSGHNYVGGPAFRWREEYYVDTVNGSPTYGQAVAFTGSNHAALRAKRQWMGAPLGAYQRIYAVEAFAEAANLITNGGFETNTQGWTGTRAVLSRDTTRAIEGSASLRAVITADARQTNDAAFILGPSVTLTAGRQYTLSLAVYAEREGLLFPRFGSQISGGLFCGPGWNKLLWTFTSTASETVQLRLDVGAMFTSTINMDRIMLFAANADVFRRDFAKAVVVVNATPTSRTIALGGTFQRIAGTQDDVNNGAVLTEVIVPAYDAAILVRPQS